MIRIAQIILFTLLLLPIQLMAESNLSWYFRHYTNKQGLSHNTVYCSVQDAKGFMWFGTDDGLNRFDGYTFKVYRFDPSLPKGEGLPSDCIHVLFTDSAGKLWVCTTEGTCCYDEMSDSFKRLDQLPEELRDEHFQRIIEDKQGFIWLLSNQICVRFHPSDNVCETYSSEDLISPVGATLSDDGQLVIAGLHDLYMFRSETNRFLHYPLLTPEEKEAQVTLSVVCNVPGIGALVGTNKAGLKLWHKNSGVCETIISDTQVRDVTAYSQTSYWIASESGVYIYDLIDKSITHQTKSLTNTYTISDNAVYSITKDSEGGMWIGAFFGGISYLPQQYTPFHFFIGGRTHPGMTGNAVREICRDQYGNLWLGTEDNGINRYDPVTNEIVNYSLSNQTNRLSATNIHGLYAEGDCLWVGTYNKGIDVLDIPSGKLIKRYSREAPYSSIPADFVLCFYRLNNGDFVVGTSSGIVIYDPSTDRFVPWHRIHALIRQIYQDNQGLIWIVSNNGLHCYNQKTQVMRHYTLSDNRRGLETNNITSVFEDSKGTIWVTTMYGFARYDRASDSFGNLTMNDGLPSNITYRIVEDDEGLLWISTANGLVRFDPETNQLRTFSNRDGLHETQFNYSSSYKAVDGTIYMGTINGMIAFNPKQFREDPYVPPLYITRIQVAGNEELQLHSGQANKDDFVLKLPYHTSTFTLSYAALNFSSPDAVHYAYRLEGIDKEWVDMGTTREVTFAKLAPGKYTFVVRSTNSSSRWQENNRSLSILITPPFWATSWAIACYILLILGVGVLFYRYKKQQLLLKHQQAQEQFETEKEKELYQAKIQFFTFITHEIRTPLTLIKAPLEKIMRLNEGSTTLKRNLHTIEKNTQRLLDLSNQLLDFRKTESKGFRLNFVRTDVKLWLETIIQPFLPVFENEGKTLLCDLSNQSLDAYIDREAFSKIISNLLTNALKYSDKQIEIKLTSVDSSCFIITVTNDGLLIPEEEKEAIFTPFYRVKETENMQGSGIGLSLSRSLTEFHNGTLVYLHTEDRRNRFVLTLPVRQEDYCFESQTPTVDGKEEETLGATDTMNDEKSTASVILVVEDQQDMRQFIVGELSESWQVLEAENGKAALDVLAKQQVALIISDIMMPEMDGFELCNRLKNDVNYSHIPLILLTAQHNLQSRLKGLNQGADAYLEKPFSIELLTAQIANLLRSREMLNKAFRDKPFTSTESLSVSPVDDLFLDKLNELLEKNLTNEALTVEFIATETGMSTSSFYRKVKGLSGLSPVDFIRIYRLKKAVELLQQGEKRINEVAFAVGFSSPAYFSTCFQKQYGKSPTEFLKDMM